MWVNHAKDKCRDIQIIVKDQAWGRAETRKGRRASREIVNAIKSFNQKRVQNRIILEVASCDEFYLDLSKEVNYRMKNNEAYPLEFTEKQNIHFESTKHKYKTKNLQYRIDIIYPRSAIKYQDEERLLHGAQIADELTAWVLNNTQMTCSVGVSCNKFLAKVACPLHKPAGITVLTKAGFQRKRSTLKIEDMPSLGGIVGAGLKNKFNLKTMKQLHHLTIFNEDLMRQSGYGIDSITRIRSFVNGDCNQQVISKEFKDTISSQKTKLSTLYSNVLISIKARMHKVCSVF